MKKIEIVDFLKGYALFTIVLFHFLQTFHWQHPGGKLISFGGTGVHLFVLLSGFGLYLSHLNKPPGYVSFLKKRFLRIYMPYILVVLVTALVSFVVPVFKGSLYALGGHIFLYKMFDESIMGSYGYVLWFVSMIIQFYLAFHLIILLRKKLKDSAFLLISLAISLLWIVFVIVMGKETERVWNSFFLRYLWEFAVGIYLAEKFYTGMPAFLSKIKISYYLYFGIVNCLLYAWLALQGGETGRMINDIPALLGYSSLAVWLYLLKINIVNKFFLFVGSESYAVYLWHTVVLMTILHFTTAFPLYISLLIALALVFVLAAWYQHFIHIIFKRIQL